MCQALRDPKLAFDGPSNLMVDSYCMKDGVTCIDKQTKSLQRAFQIDIIKFIISKEGVCEKGKSKRKNEMKAEVYVIRDVEQSRW